MTLERFPRVEVVEAAAAHVDRLTKRVFGRVATAEHLVVFLSFNFL